MINIYIYIYIYYMQYIYEYIVYSTNKLYTMQQMYVHPRVRA